MYFPILRGKGSEFLALEEEKELILGKGIVPIIELVKETKNFKHVIDIPIIIIANPIVGEFTKDASWIDSYIIENIDKHKSITVGYQITNMTTKEDIGKFIVKWRNYDKCFIHHYKFNDIDWLLREYKDENIINIINIDKTDKNYLNYINLHFEKVVILSDGFDKKNRNADYPEWSYFTNYCLEYKDDDLYGYSDYLTIGSKYIEGGGPAKVVAIHYTYKNDEGDIITKHFTSEDSSKDKEFKEKYMEALTKLANFIYLNEEDNTDASNRFYSLYEDNHVTNLAKLKQYSMQRHIESIILYSK